ncbi:MAG: site-specific integrase [Alloprevotella sp.]|nr:site-specific integrase [Alloprevotella sp.]
MATVKVKFRASSNSDKEGTLYFQIIHNRITRQIHTGYKLFQYEWETEQSEIILSGSDTLRHDYLISLKEALAADTLKLKGIIAKLEKVGGTYTAEKIVEQFHAPENDGGFISFALRLIDQLKQIGKIRTADTYTTVLNSFKRFRNKLDVLLEDVVSNLMIEYESWLKENGICKNTISFYMRNLRAIYNQAVEKELVTQRFPFKHVYTGIDKTVKRAVPIKVIKQIKELDLTLFPMLDYARDLFMFSFYTRGMSFIDMAYLKEKDLQNGILSYRRHKTNQQLFIKWERPMQTIIDKYYTADNPYLLPIIKDMNIDKRRQYKNAAHLVNNKLKKIGELLGLNISLTSYVARHSWASIAKSKNISISTISEAMGHDSETTTRIYLASLDTSSVDKANSIVLNLL